MKLHALLCLLLIGSFASAEQKIAKKLELKKLSETSVPKKEKTHELVVPDFSELNTTLPDSNVEVNFQATCTDSMGEIYNQNDAGYAACLDEDTKDENLRDHD